MDAQNKFSEVLLEIARKSAVRFMRHRQPALLGTFHGKRRRAIELDGRRLKVSQRIGS
jgi:hypothetical protein